MGARGRSADSGSVDAARRSEKLVTDFTRGNQSMYADTASTTREGAMQIKTLQREEAKVLGMAQTREYANYLVAMRRMDEEVKAFDQQVAGGNTHAE